MLDIFVDITEPSIPKLKINKFSGFLWLEMLLKAYINFSYTWTILHISIKIIVYLYFLSFLRIDQTFD